MTKFSRSDVSDAKEMEAFADHVRNTFNTKHINLLFNNAGIAGGGSFLKETREQWEKTFSVCWATPRSRTQCATAAVTS
jgi:NAD(P)-dependent dehydrogenase (short-subunit alcohol dehydrogenase family)